MGKNPSLAAPSTIATAAAAVSAVTGPGTHNQPSLMCFYGIWCQRWIYIFYYTAVPHLGPWQSLFQTCVFTVCLKPERRTIFTCAECSWRTVAAYQQQALTHSGSNFNDLNLRIRLMWLCFIFSSWHLTFMRSRNASCASILRPLTWLYINVSVSL